VTVGIINSGASFYQILVKKARIKDAFAGSSAAQRKVVFRTTEEGVG
jgi:hypothetical protein